MMHHTGSKRPADYVVDTEISLPELHITLR
jgi:hypothetical protein